jgi:hypothetical protein
MVVRIAGRRVYLWRAVDHEGEVLDMLVHLWVRSRFLVYMRSVVSKPSVNPL